MPDPSSLRDSTQIVVPRESLSGLEAGLDDACTVTVFEEGEGYYRIIGSPVEIKRASEFLARNGVTLP